MPNYLAKSPVPLSIEADQGMEDPQANIAVPMNVECQILEKPKLYKARPPAAKARCLPPTNSFGIHKNELNDSNCDINGESAYELDEADEKMLPNAPSLNVASVPSVPMQTPEVLVEEDLAVSLHDLDNIFDTSSSEGEDNMDVPATPSKLVPYDEFSGKIELSRMYPTPPSLEQHAVPSPFGPLIGNDIATSETDAYR
ncbi:uncharacterized protein CEXT_457051 [Caerostris extrusa]|uniref:Uncharacterized protein n=1 Tax=Caerostris extrusa TaxID=172846 RepID=A0AAV4PM95_CAEEX|nr:uncharacterized protein CEXT_457051 [Caerostris extrusa]